MVLSLRVLRPSVPTALRAVAVLVVALLVCLLARNLLLTPADATTASVPQNATMEAQLGIRFSRVAVVGDGGLVTVTYVVLDAEKAQQLQASQAHPPVLSSESRKGSTSRVSLMKQGHSLRAGQTYYLVYENTRGALRHGERVTITDGALRLAHVPVL
ncbi:hypothetical protein CLV35_1069 [Motilibacter peucedani]|uniref:Uncharacterized protein n=1 Tax=Motilibacter peucedani TaxID=598650 RepID=A0A420XR53_9ACTN|nr:hypothetical protein [Motilibacter peucedani]RKS77383.1 hypothetical protein CLV35_1069 [Motilibacter peucedani]